MKVNYNMSAIVANNQLLSNESKLTNSINKLSSGYKINRAGDNPAGLAISHKMNMQIKGLEQASQNALDGISVTDTAEGAVNEVHEMLQRMRELAVQGANGTYTEEDRVAIQKEIDKLCEEITRISEDTEYNKSSILNGSFDIRRYSDVDGVNARFISDEVPAGVYTLEITGKATKTKLEGTEDFNAVAGNTGKISINGVTVELTAMDTAETYYEKLREAGKTVNVDVERETAAGPFTFTSQLYGSAHKIEISGDATILTSLGIAGAPTQGLDAKVELKTRADTNSPIGFNDTATIKADGQNVKITDRNGFEMIVKLDEVYHDKVAAGASADSFEERIAAGDFLVNIDVKDFGAMVVQIGANEGQTMDICIPEFTLENMGIDHLNFLSEYGCGTAITALDNAIAFTSSVRSKLGAYQNRLDHAVASLDVASESMTQAYSRIMDVDMAEEMTKYTQYNVLQQAGTAVLAQANDLPQNVLQLLQ